MFYILNISFNSNACCTGDKIGRFTSRSDHILRLNHLIAEYASILILYKNKIMHCVNPDYSLRSAPSGGKSPKLCVY